MSPRRTRIEPPRSPKAGQPPDEPVTSPRVRRRQKTGYALVRKGTTLVQAEHGPRALRGAKTPKVKKR